MKLVVHWLGYVMSCAKRDGFILAARCCVFDCRACACVRVLLLFEWDIFGGYLFVLQRNV